jgi:hypothetical protein
MISGKYLQLLLSQILQQQFLFVSILTAVNEELHTSKQYVTS